MTQSIAIVGAGLVGRLLAWQYLNQPVQITLFDRTDRNSRDSAGMTAAAMLAPYTEAVTTDKLVCDIGRVSLSLWPQILSEIEKRTGRSIYFSMQGTLVVAHSQDHGDWLGFNQMAEARLGRDAFEIVDRSRLMELEPSISERFQQASYFSEEGVLCNEDLFACLNLALESHDLDWHENLEIRSLDEVEPYGQFDWIFDCRGMGARNDLRGLRGVRGEVVRVFAPEVNITRPIRLMHPRFPLYIAPRNDHQYVIGATQIESDAMYPVTVRSGLELLSALYSLHPGFAEARIIRMEANCRPAFNDNLPRIGVQENRISINGLYRHGYLFAPALLQDVQYFVVGNQHELSFPSLFDIDS